MTKRIAALIFLGVLTSTAAMADTCDTEITKVVLAHVAHVNRIGTLGKTLVASTATSEVKPALIEWALKVRTRYIAEELIASYRDRNAEPAQIDAQTAEPFTLIELEKYQANGAIDWEKVVADFPDTQTIVTLSRPGCDANNSYGLTRLQYHFREPRTIPESILFHMTRERRGWEAEIMRHGSQESWDKSECTHGSSTLVTEFRQICEDFFTQARKTE